MTSAALGLDYGDKRVGVALSVAVGIASPLATLDNSAGLIDRISQLIDEHQVSAVVIGLPRDINGHETEQTEKARRFAAELKTKIQNPIYLSDEAGTSLEAEARLKAGQRDYQKADIDALAAALILEDFLAHEANQVKI